MRGEGGREQNFFVLFCFFFSLLLFFIFYSSSVGPLSKQSILISLLLSHCYFFSNVCIMVLNVFFTHYVLILSPFRLFSFFFFLELFLATLLFFFLNASFFHFRPLRQIENSRFFMVAFLLENLPKISLLFLSSFKLKKIKIKFEVLILWVISLQLRMRKCI